ncbi:MAG: flagellin [Gammaproteobacteria bacterium]|nr:flagellin [Gammaproteobacteria bacterium]
MPQVIGTNVYSLNAQRNLDRNGMDLQQVMQRLSSGLRINSARDDAAGLAIAERFTSQVRGYNQGVRNAADAISLAQVAEGALGEVANNLQRMRELAIQAANSTNSSTDKRALNLEIMNLKREITRTTHTQFNGVQVLGTGAGDFYFQVGPNGDRSVDGITVDTTNVRNTSAFNNMMGWTDKRVAANDTFLELNGKTFSREEMILQNAGGGVWYSADSYYATQDIAEFNAKTGGVYTELSYQAYRFNELTNRALSLISLCDQFLVEVNSQRAHLGAAQNRFEAVIRNGQNVSEQLSASRSRIIDADFAAETARLTKTQILQQAGTSVLSQANQVPQSVLQLLGG